MKSEFEKIIDFYWHMYCWEDSDWERFDNVDGFCATLMELGLV
jgi:hypothetical protein